MSNHNDQFALPLLDVPVEVRLKILKSIADELLPVVSKTLPQHPRYSILPAAATLTAVIDSVVWAAQAAGKIYSLTGGTVAFVENTDKQALLIVSTDSKADPEDLDGQDGLSLAGVVRSIAFKLDEEGNPLEFSDFSNTLLNAITEQIESGKDIAGIAEEMAPFCREKLSRMVLNSPSGALLLTIPLLARQCGQDASDVATLVSLAFDAENFESDDAELCEDCGRPLEDHDLTGIEDFLEGISGNVGQQVAFSYEEASKMLSSVGVKPDGEVSIHSEEIPQELRDALVSAGIDLDKVMVVRGELGGDDDTSSTEEAPEGEQAPTGSHAFEQFRRDYPGVAEYFAQRGGQ